MGVKFMVLFQIVLMMLILIQITMYYLFQNGKCNLVDSHSFTIILWITEILNMNLLVHVLVVVTCVVVWITLMILIFTEEINLVLFGYHLVILSGKISILW